MTTDHIVLSRLYLAFFIDHQLSQYNNSAHYTPHGAYYSVYWLTYAPWLRYDWEHDTETNTESLPDKF